ncbi:F-box/kelch-repeat protein At3g61590-like [Rhododendron vialii]|uniref:F-box/kelch-repeat protein At3g61590-like n=1 Tax=Rhododendron vialii TaxID=182163 RepID=UPI00265F6E4A|nr:F-box/kelch-repeat protein At3g61590-like [Rhododendron vialii]
MCIKSHCNLLLQEPFTTIPSMWSNLPFDLLSTIFSFLPPDSLVHARSACSHWNKCAMSAYAAPPDYSCRHAPWFFAFPTRHRGHLCYAHNPITDNWHVLSLDFVPHPIRPIASVCGLILFRQTSTTSLRLSVCNPFTKQFKPLPLLNITRTNPAVGLIEVGPSPQVAIPQFRVYIAGGMSEAPRGSSYETTLEMYDSQMDAWQIIGPMPVEFAVRLTVWTPNESVHSNGIIYWMTSARAYSVMGFEIGTNTWRELSVPMADRLEFAALVWRNEKLTLVGGTCVEDAFVWELSGDDTWSLIGKVPAELGRRFLGLKVGWGGTKCVGIDGAVCLYKDLGSGMVVWREDVEKGRWEWIWVDGCCSMRGKQVQNFPIKGVVLHPNLGASCLGLR